MSPVPISSLDSRWRPKSRAGGVCGHTFRGGSCVKRGSHYCEPRADRVVAFFAELLVHTKGPFARKSFILRPWQEAEIIRPLFGEVVWSPEWGRYIRRYRLAYVVMGRKNGKSELVAGITLYLIVGDDEEASEVYGAAKDTKQAGKVFEPALRMMQLSPALSSRLTHNKNSRRLIDEKTSSYYEIITSDAEGELGHNPHGFVLDEVLSQPDDSLWTAMRTAAGTRLQSLMLAITTETDRPASFGASLIDEAERIQDEPERAPHVFAYVRKLPADADPWDENNWGIPNPALGDFLSVQALRDEALEAKNDPTKENSFRQFRLNQRVNQASRWMPMHLYRATCGEPWLTPDQRRDEMAGRVAYCGLDLAAKFDLTAWCLIIPDDDGGCDVQWRFWLPEGALVELDRRNGGQVMQWVKQGWIKVTDGDVIDYQQVYDDIGADANHFNIKAGGADRWSLMPVIQEVAKRTSLPVDDALVMVEQTYKGMTPGMVELMGLVKTERFRHHGNPVAQWCFDNVQVRRAPFDPELIRPDKPDRGAANARIDAVPAAAMAVEAWRLRGRPKHSIYDDREPLVISAY